MPRVEASGGARTALAFAAPPALAASLTLAAVLTAGALAASGATAPMQDWSFARAPFVYTSGAGGNADVWLSSGPLGETRNLTDSPAQDHWAGWFPDGERIAFQSLRDDNFEVYVLDVDGGAPANVSNDPAHDLLPEVSPDGERILFFSDRGIEHGPTELPGHLYVMDADGGNLERLTEEPLTSTFFGAWSPDGGSIVFARDFDGDIDLVLLDLDTRTETRIDGTDDAESAARFSPDGSRLAFHVVREDGEARIAVSARDGGDRREITRGAQHYQPAWSPDGRWLMFSGAPMGAGQFDLMVASVSGGQVRPLVATEADERSGSWRPIR